MTQKGQNTRKENSLSTFLILHENNYHIITQSIIEITICFKFSNSINILTIK